MKKVRGFQPPTPNLSNLHWARMGITASSRKNKDVDNVDSDNDYDDDELNKWRGFTDIANLVHCPIIIRITKPNMIIRHIHSNPR